MIYIFPFGCLWPPLGVFGVRLAPPGPTLASVLALWGALGLSLGVLWSPLDPFGLPLGSLWLSLGSPWATLAILLKIGRPLPRNVSNSRNCHQKAAFGNLPPVPAVPPDPAEVVSASAAQTSPLPAPGVRMTGVKQTPSNNYCASSYPHHIQISPA